MPSPWFLLLMAILVAGTYVAGRHDGAKINEAAWQKREAEINGKQADLIAKANQAVRDEEHAKAEKFVEISTTLQGKIKEKDRALQIALDSVRSGGIRLSIPTSGTATCGNAESGTAASTGRDNAGARAELSPTASNFLTGEASRADKIVEQLTACQALVRADRR